jgi:hypothetical protein
LFSFFFLTVLLESSNVSHFFNHDNANTSGELFKSIHLTPLAVPEISHPSLARASSEKRLPPLMRPPSTVPTPTSQQPGSKMTAPLSTMVSSPLSDWIQLGLNLDIPPNRRSFSNISNSSDLNNPVSMSSRISTAGEDINSSTINQGLLSRQNSGFLLESFKYTNTNREAGDEGILLDGAGGYSEKSKSTTHARNGSSGKFFSSGTPSAAGGSSRKRSESPLLTTGFDLFKQHHDPEALNKVKKSLLLLNEQITQVKQHSPTHASSSQSPSSHRFSSSNHPPRSPLNGMSLAPRITSTPSYSAPSSTRSLQPSTVSQKASHKTSAFGDNSELSTLLENDSYDEFGPPATLLQNPPVLKKQMSKRGNSSISSSVDEIWMKDPRPVSSASDISSHELKQPLVSKSLTDDIHHHPMSSSYYEKSSSRGVSSADSGTPSKRTSSIASPRIGGSRFQASGLSLMREGSQRSLSGSSSTPVFESLEGVSTKSRSSPPIAGFTMSEKSTSASTKSNSTAARASALAAALSAGDAVGKLMAEMVVGSKKR